MQTGPHLAKSFTRAAVTNRNEKSTQSTAAEPAISSSGFMSPIFRSNRSGHVVEEAVGHSLVRGGSRVRTGSSGPRLGKTTLTAAER